MYPLLMLSLFSSLVGVQVIKAQQEIMDVLTVRGIQVVNEQNKPVVAIGSSSSGGGMIFVHDENGESGIVMTAEAELRGLGIFKPNGELGMGMYANENGGVIEGYGKGNSIGLHITQSKLIYYTNTVTGVRLVGSELSRDGLKVGHVYPAHYKSDGISYNGIGGFKLPRNITN